MSVSPPKRIARQSKRETLESAEQDGDHLQWQALGRESRDKGSNFDAS